MREYELIYILKGDVEGEAADKVQDKVKGFIKTHKGELLGVKFLGKKTLAYEIGKETRGNYYLVRFLSEGAIIAKLERYFKLSEHVIRFLSVKISDDADLAKSQEAWTKSLEAPAEPKKEGENASYVK